MFKRLDKWLRLMANPGTARAEPEVTMTARVYRAATDSWEPITITNIKTGKT